MDRQQILALLLVILMIGSSVAYGAALVLLIEPPRVTRFGARGIQQFQAGAPDLKKRGPLTGRKREASRPGRKPTPSGTDDGSVAN